MRRRGCDGVGVRFEGKKQLEVEDVPLAAALAVGTGAGEPNRFVGHVCFARMLLPLGMFRLTTSW